MVRRSPDLREPLLDPLAGVPMTQINPQLSVQGITRLNTIVTILTDCLQTCKNGNVKVRKGRAKLYSQAMLRLAEMSDNQIETLEKSKKIT